MQKPKRKTYKYKFENAQQMIDACVDYIASTQPVYDPNGGEVTNPSSVVQLFYLTFAAKKNEEMWALMLDAQHRVIAREQLAMGTIDAANVYPRTLVQHVIKHNAAAVVLAHNHPSGVLTPSQADLHITQRIIDAMGLVNTRVLDHLIFGHGVGEHHSMAEHHQGGL